MRAVYLIVMVVAFAMVIAASVMIAHNMSVARGGEGLIPVPRVTVPLSMEQQKLLDGHNLDKAMAEIRKLQGDLKDLRGVVTALSVRVTANAQSYQELSDAKID